MYLTEKCQEPIIGVWARAGGEGVGGVGMGFCSKDEMRHHDYGAS